MLNSAILLAQAALVMQLALAQAPQGAPKDRLSPEAAEQEMTAFDKGEDRPFRVMLDAREPQKSGQVRIEQRVTVRITPRPQASRQDLLAQLPRGEAATRIEERVMGKCVRVSRISGVQTGNENKLILFLRDRRILTARLEKTCKPEDFYSGFYLERNEDGMLCINRDLLQSRAGTKCAVDQFRQLVAVEE
ncbi:MAG TPA: hypothetical protein VLA37_06495 [Sphingomonadaceae bacterium]|nr:hypothetical protein [Sphingomonadaceae bacterium]